MCFDYRVLNKQAIKDHYPLLRIDLLLDRLGKARIFGKLDLAQGYCCASGSVRSVVLYTSNTCTNKPTGEDLCAGYLNGRD